MGGAGRPSFSTVCKRRLTMALATRCPHCATTFRVAHDQLKLRAGLVRCGACKQIFNGVENLLGPELVPIERPVAAARQPLPESATPQSESTAPAAPSSPRSDQASGTASSTPAGMPASAGSATPSSINLTAPTTFSETEAPQRETEKDVDPLTRMTLMDFTAFEEMGLAPMSPGPAEKAPVPGAKEDESETPDEIEKAIEDLHSRPWREEKRRKKNGADESTSYEETEEPDFVRHARRRQQVGHRMKWVYGISSVLLALLLAAQLAYAFRDQLAQRVPQLGPLLQQACSRLNCRIGFPAPISALAIESSELQAMATRADTYQLRVLLRNRYDTTVAWPHLELTLNGAQEQALARRSFSPVDYLSSPEQAQAGFAAQSEQLVNVHFVLQNQSASGFRVYLFYP